MRARTLSIFAGLAATALLAAPAFAQMANAPRTVALKGAGGADLGTAVVTMGPSGTASTCTRRATVRPPTSPRPAPT
jgi:hypothetical protein